MAQQRKQSMIALMKIHQMNQAHRQTQQELQELSKQHKEALAELKKHKQLAGEYQKKHGELDKRHRDASDELHELKVKFDGDYAFKYNQEKKAASGRKREATNNKRKRTKELRDIKRASEKPSTS